MPRCPIRRDGKLLHDQQSARAGFGLAYAKTGNTDVKLDDWRMRRGADGGYRTRVERAPSSRSTWR